MDKSDVGRRVHYVSHGTPVRADGTQAYTQECRAAAITELGAWIDMQVISSSDAPTFRQVNQRWDPAAAGLSVSNPTGYLLNRGVRYDPGSPPVSATVVEWSCDGLEHEGGTWHFVAGVS